MPREKDTEFREQEREVEDKANKKDTEKRAFNWKLIEGVCLALIAVAGVTAGVLGGKFDLLKDWIMKREIFYSICQEL